jgi:phosphoribosyl 1,2-cyclic phosphodiesterase
MDPDPTRLAASIQGRDQPGIWWEDSIEVFLDPEGQRSRYYQFIANAGGGFYDTCSMEETFNASGARIATSRGADHWTMEIFLPYEDITAGLLPGIGSIWYANFIRDIPPRSSKVAVGADDYEMVYQRWSTNGKPSHLDFSAFGKLRFVE